MMLPNRPTRRSLLLGALGAVLAACSSPASRLAVAGGPDVSEPARLSPPLQPGEGRRAAPPRQPTRPPSAPAPVRLAWQTDGRADRLRRPTGLAVDRRGALIVVDTGHGRLVHLMATTGEAISRIGGPGEDPSQFRFAVPTDSAIGSVGTVGDAAAAADGFRFVVPTDSAMGSVGTIGGAVAAAADGSLYVADAVRARAQRLDRAGRVVATLTAGPQGIDSLVEPTGIAIDDRRGRVYLADASVQRIHSFDRDGRWQVSWGGCGVEPGEFRRPVAVAVDLRSQVYVADFWNHRIQVFDEAGRFVTMWGGPGAQPGDFAAPIGVAVDGAGRVYVATAQRIQVFNGAGVVLAAWDTWDSPGGQDDAFGELGGVAVDEQGAIFVTDQMPARVLKFQPRGPWPTPAAAWPTPRPATPTAAPPPPQPLPTLPPMTPTVR